MIGEWKTCEKSATGGKEIIQGTILRKVSLIKLATVPLGLARPSCLPLCLARALNSKTRRHRAAHINVNVSQGSVCRYFGLKMSKVRIRVAEV